MSGRRAKAIRREALRRGIDPLSRHTGDPMVLAPVLGKQGVTVMLPLPRINDDRRAYRAVKREAVAG